MKKNLRIIFTTIGILIVVSFNTKAQIPKNYNFVEIVLKDSGMFKEDPTYNPRLNWNKDNHRYHDNKEHNDKSKLDYQIAPWYGFKDAAVSITFDDGLKKQFTLLAPMLEKLGYRGTFFIITSWVGQGETPSWDSLSVLASKGHEIGSHTVNHALMATLTNPHPDSARMEMDSSKQRINRHIYPEKCETLAWPGGSVDYASTVLGQQYYIACRGSGYILQPQIPYNFYNVYSETLLNDNKLESQNSWVDQVLKTKGWLVERIHGIDSVGYQPLPASQYEAHFNYVKSHDDDLWVAPFKTITKYIKERMDASFSISISDSTNNTYSILLTENLPTEVYDVPLTIKLNLRGNLQNLKSIQQNNDSLSFKIVHSYNSNYAIFNAKPNNNVLKFYIQSTVEEPNLVINNIVNPISCYPNPATNSITVVNAQQGTIDILNLKGQLMKSVSTNGDKTTIDITSLSKGTYLLVAKNKKGNITRKIVKK